MPSIKGKMSSPSWMRKVYFGKDGKNVSYNTKHPPKPKSVKAINPFSQYKKFKYV